MKTIQKHECHHFTIQSFSIKTSNYGKKYQPHLKHQIMKTLNTLHYIWIIGFHKSSI